MTFDATIENCPDEQPIPWFQVPREMIRNPTLSLECKGFLSYLMSHSEKFNISIPWICKSQNISRNIIYRIINESIEAGYLKRINYLEKGMKRYKYLLSPTGRFKKSLLCPEKQDTEKQDTENQDRELDQSLKLDQSKDKEILSCPESDKPIGTQEDQPPKKEIPKEAKEAAQKLLSKVKEIHPKFKEPKIERWAEDMDKINRIDKRSWEEINAMIDWAFQDRFWVKVLMSADGLRRNWDKMAVKQVNIPHQATCVEKNRETANEIKVYLAKIGKGNLLWIAKDYVKNVNNGDSLALSLNSEKFEEILCNWFELKRS